MNLAWKIGLVAFGSSLGGLARWGVNLLSARYLPSGFPFGTFVINVTGSFFLGFLAAWLADRIAGGTLADDRAESLRLLLGVGFAGAYTTFSTFELESVDLWRGQRAPLAFLYLVGSVAVGLVAVRLGMYVGSGK